MAGRSGRGIDPSPERSIRLGIDMGGTFVDCAVVEDGALAAVGKVPTTPASPVDGILEAVDVAAAALDLTGPALLARATEIVYGTTAGLNALLERRGARVGLLATHGHEDALLIGRVHQKVAGLGADELIRVAELAKPEPLVPRTRIVGISERIDASGAALVALDEAGVADAARTLATAGCDAIAICFLWSFRNPAHEVRAAEIVRELLPGVPVSRSSEVAPVLGEYERTAATVVNAYLAHAQGRHLGGLEGALRTRGFRGELAMLHSAGGATSARAAAERPVETLRSGPVGGALATARLGGQIGARNLLATDVGGTTFDVSLVTDGRPAIGAVTLAARFHLAVPSVDIASIGAGGGSIAWVDDDGGLHVGPRSAGAEPGPACYGRGGTEATVTDADVVLGRLNPGALLGGRIALDRRAAERAVGALARSLGVDPTTAAAGIVRVADARMADLVRQVTLERGHDPRSLVLVAFGGAAGLHAGAYGFDAGAVRIVVPRAASLFSALGLALAERRRSYLASGPLPVPFEVAAVRAEFAALARRAAHDLGTARLELRREIAFRYRRQTHDLAVPLDGARLSAAILARTVERFEHEYERVFGSGTAYRAAGIEATSLRLTATDRRSAPADDAQTIAVAPGARRRPEHGRSRPAWFGRWERATPAFDGETLRAGDAVDGPALVDWPTTTLVVHRGQRATVDGFGHVHLEANA